MENISVLYDLTRGINYYDRTIGSRPIHAERDAIRKLPILNNKSKKKKKINILILKVSKSKQIRMSKPCVNCLYNIINLPPKKGYVIKNIYYSTNEGDIIKTTPKKMIECNDFHFSKFSKWKTC